MLASRQPCRQLVGTIAIPEHLQGQRRAGPIQAVALTSRADVRIGLKKAVQHPLAEALAETAELVRVVEGAQIALNHPGSHRGLNPALIPQLHRAGDGDGGHPKNPDLGQLEFPFKQRLLVLLLSRRSRRTGRDEIQDRRLSHERH